MPRPAINFCSVCGSQVVKSIPNGDTHERAICPNSECATIHYVNPNNVVGCIPETSDGRILLCRRAIEPRRGYWTFPAGFMEMHETLSIGAARECLEEAEAMVEILGLQSVIDVPFAGQVHIMYRAKLVNDEYGVGEESLESVLYNEEDIPWDDIAFPTVKYALKTFLDDRKNGSFKIHTAVINRNRFDVVQELPPAAQ